MAVNNLQSLTDMFGETWTAWTDGTNINLQSNRVGAPVVTAFTQATADSPISLEDTQDGRLIIAYLDGSGNRLSQSSARDGDNGTWS